MAKTLSPTVAQAVAEELARAGVDRVFGLPGGEVLRLIDAIREAGIEYVLCRHEADAGLMAAVYGKLKGVPGVVLTTLGPGACNLLLPLASSRLDREPLVAISAQVPDTWSQSRIHQRLPLRETFAPVAKLTAAIDVFNCREVVGAALAAATSGPEGCVFLTLAAEVSQAPTAAVTGGGSHNGHRATPALEEWAAATLRERLFAARRPVLAIGAGAAREQAPLLRRWVESWDLPVVVTPKVKGVVDERDSHFGGVIGGLAIDRLMVEGLERADLIVGWGLDPTEIDGDWHERLPVVWVQDSPWATGVTPSRDLVLADMARLLEKLLEEPERADWSDPLEYTRAERQRVFGEAQSGPGYLAPTAVVRVLSEAVPDDTIVATDVGSHKYVFGQFWPSRHPQTFFMSNGLSGMGYGIPAAIGAKLARPGQVVLAAVGDGGFSMNSQELEVATRVGAPVIVVVLVDGSYSMIEVSQQRKGLAQYGVRFDPIDTVQNARSCGARAQRVETEADLATAVREALGQDVPTVIEVPIRVADYAAIV